MVQGHTITYFEEYAIVGDVLPKIKWAILIDGSSSKRTLLFAQVYLPHEEGT